MSDIAAVRRQLKIKSGVVQRCVHFNLPKPRHYIMDWTDTILSTITRHQAWEGNEALRQRDYTARNEEGQVGCGRG
jgi:hypothetical protein